MAKRSLAELTAAFAPKEGTGNTAWKDYFGFWKSKVGQESVVRLLPDLDDENPMGFLVEKHIHQFTVNGKKEEILCGRQHNEDGECPFCEHSAKFYAMAEEAKKNNDAEAETRLRAEGKKFYKKKSYLGRALIVSTTAQELAEDVGQVRFVEFGPAIFKNMNAAFQSGDLDEVPFDLKGGYNYVLRKTQSGQYASYDTSSFRYKQVELSDDVIKDVIMPALKDLKAHVGDTAQRLDAASLKQAFARITSMATAPIGTTGEEPTTETNAAAVKVQAGKVSEMLRQRKAQAENQAQ